VSSTTQETAPDGSVTTTTSSYDHGTEHTTGQVTVGQEDPVVIDGSSPARDALQQLHQGQ
jgi:hypothetical protein